jgi:hypothetical protein
LAREDPLAYLAISLAIAAVIMFVSVGGYFFLQHSVDQQER